MQQPNEQQQQQQRVQSSQQHPGNSWLPWGSGRKGSAGGMGCQKPPPPYNRGFKQNWLEVLFPELFLQQEELRQQQQGLLRGQVVGQRGRQQQREGTEGSVAQQQQQQQSTGGVQSGQAWAERKQQ
jgi:hypothetical protein